MFIPERAVISAKTEEEAKQLLDFLTSNGYQYGDYPANQNTYWDSNVENTCYDLDYPNVLHADRHWYEQRTNWNDYKRPKEGEEHLLFCSVEFFLAYCNDAFYEEIDDVSGLTEVI